MARIESTGSYLPKKVVTNEQFDTSSKIFDSSPIENFLTGYNKRRHADPDESGVSMAVKASSAALASSQYCADDIDLIIGGVFPSKHLYGEDTNLVQSEIGATNASVLPINTTCSTFVSALNLAESLIQTGKKKCILISIAVNWIHHALDTRVPNFAFAGDGAAAVIIDNNTDKSSLLDVCEINNSTPSVFESMVMKNPAFTNQKEYFTITEPKGISTAKDLVMLPISVAEKLLARNKDINVDKVLMHQSGLKMMQMWTNKISIPFDKVRHTLGEYANMTAANIPVSLDHWRRKGDIQRGDTLLFFAPAAGGHYIAMLWKY